MKKFQHFLYGVIASMVIIIVVSLPLHAYAQGKLGDAMTKLRPLGDAAGVSGGGDIQSTFGTIINAALSLIGTIFFILMIYAGFLWMTARGDEGQIDKSKQIISGTIIGLVLVVSAYAITVFVTGRFQTESTTPGTVGSQSGNVNGGCCRMCSGTECSGVWFSGSTPAGWCTNGTGSCGGDVSCLVDQTITDQANCEALR